MMRGLRHAVLILFVAVGLMRGCPSMAQEAATLVADSLRIEADARLIAEGNVEVLFQGTRLTARRITYDRSTEILIIDGPLVLTEGSGTLLLADSATLRRDLTEGILISARLVLDRQLQIAAAKISRTGGRYTRLRNAVASSCEVCANNPVPIWEIRARSIVHDQQARQLYFDRAQFRVAGIPILYIPRLRLPDPTLQRSNGFLIPRVRTTSELGFGVKLPYFLTLGESRDLTITPYFSTGRTRTVELRYRQAFATGEIEFNGALSRDSIGPGGTRHYLFGSGAFALPRDFRLTFGVQTVSDNAYLLDYDYSDADRLRSEVEISRTRRNEYISARLIAFNSLRDGDDNATLPSIVGDLTFHRRFRPGVIGGEGGFRFQTHSHLRSSSSDAVGRDVSRASARLDWRRNWLLPAGMIASAMSEVNADLYAIRQDASFPGTVARVTPAFGAELRWPFEKVAASGAVIVVEPVAQLVWSPDNIEDVPNEDSTLVEFDEGNLFALSRFPGSDAYERGLRANLGLGWSRTARDGSSLGVLVGRVLRAETPVGFGTGTGLDRATSDWLATVHLRNASGLSLTNRALFDDSLSFSRNELRLTYADARTALSSSYLFLDAAPDESRPLDTHELVMDASVALTDRWRGSFDGRFDFQTSRAAAAGLGLQYQTECIVIDLSLSRRFTSSTSVRPTTDFGLSVVLNGFGGTADTSKRRRSCVR